MTPAQMHIIRRRAEIQSRQVADVSPGIGSALQHMLAQLGEHKRALHDIQSVERKIEFKQQILPDYDAYIDGILAADSGMPDPVVTTIMVWRFDVGDFAGGIALADYVINHGIPLPDQYQRTAPTLIAEEVAEGALRPQAGDVNIPRPTLDQLQHVAELTAELDMHDQVRAKLEKAIGYALRDAQQPTEALPHLERALQLNPRVGVKKDIEALERDIKNSAKG